MNELRIEVSYGPDVRISTLHHLAPEEAFELFTQDEHLIDSECFRRRIEMLPEIENYVCFAGARGHLLTKDDVIADLLDLWLKPTRDSDFAIVAEFVNESKSLTAQGNEAALLPWIKSDGTARVSIYSTEISRRISLLLPAYEEKLQFYLNPSAWKDLLFLKWSGDRPQFISDLLVPEFRLTSELKGVYLQPGLRVPSCSRLTLDLSAAALTSLSLSASVSGGFVANLEDLNQKAAVALELAAKTNWLQDWRFSGSGRTLSGHCVSWWTGLRDWWIARGLPDEPALEVLLEDSCGRPSNSRGRVFLTKSGWSIVDYVLPCNCGNAHEFDRMVLDGNQYAIVEPSGRMSGIREESFLDGTLS